MGRTSGSRDLLVQLDRARGEPLRDQIVSQVADAIRAGRLRAGAELPAGRVLAAQLGVSRGVVVEAYGELHQQGLLVQRARALPRVASVSAATPAAHGDPAPRLDLTPGRADVALFPRADWLRALRVELQRAPDRALERGDGRGQSTLRRALADYLGRTRAVVCDPDRVVVCQGATQAIEVACRLLGARGVETIRVEDPCASPTRTAARRAGLAARPVRVDREGIVVSELGPSDAAIVTPAHQFPTGAIMSDARRAALLERTQFVIEDDRGAEHRYDRLVGRALQGSSDDRVLYVGSASQSLAHGLRLGWLVVPPEMVADAARIRLELDGGSPTLDQLALAHMLENAAYERYLRRARAEYARRRLALLEALGSVLPGASVTGSEAGLHLVLALGEPVDRTVLAARAAEARIRIAAVEDFLADPPAMSHALCVGYAGIQAGAAWTAAHAIHRLIDPEGAPARERRLRSSTPTTPRPIRATPGEAMVDLRVMTFDVGQVDDEHMPAIVSVIRAGNADVVALQNAQGRAATIARALGWSHADRARDVISRLRLLRSPDGLHTLVEAVPGHFLAVSNLHLSSDEYGPAQLLAGGSMQEVVDSEWRIRVPELEPVLASLRALASEGVPVVVAGSLNSPCRPGWPIADALRDAGLIDVLGDRAHPTWPVPGFPVDPADGSDAIDALLVGGPGRSVATNVLGEPDGPGVDLPVSPWPSEHRAIVATIRMTPGAVAPFVTPLEPIVTAGHELHAIVTSGPAAYGGSIALVGEERTARRALARRGEDEVGADGSLPFSTTGIRPGAYDLVLSNREGGELSRAPVWVVADGATPSIGVARRRFAAGEPVPVSWRDAPGNRWDWIGVFDAHLDPGRAEPTTYRFTGARPSGTVQFDRLGPGEYVAALIFDDTSDVLALARFRVLDR